jgi:hypothetical protein
MNFPNCKKPCKNCPFRKDTLKGWLPNIEEYVYAKSFVCHETNTLPERDRLQCAGHMLLRGEESQFVRFAKRINVELELSGREQVFDTVADCIMHHKNTDHEN